MILFCVVLLAFNQMVTASWLEQNHDSSHSNFKPASTINHPGIRCTPSKGSLSIPTVWMNAVVDSTGNIFTTNKHFIYSTNLITQQSNYNYPVSIPYRDLDSETTVRSVRILLVVQKGKPTLLVGAASTSKSSHMMARILFFVLNADSGEMLWSWVVEEPQGGLESQFLPMSAHPSGYVLISFYDRVDAFIPPTKSSNSTYRDCLKWSFLNVDHLTDEFRSFAGQYVVVSPSQGQEILLLSKSPTSKFTSVVNTIDPQDGRVLKTIPVPHDRSEISSIMATKDHLFVMVIGNPISGLMIALNNSHDVITKMPMVARAAGPGKTVVYCTNTEVSLRDASNPRKVIWVTPLPYENNLHTPSVTVDGNGVVYVYLSSTTNHLCAFDIKRGQLLWDMPTDSTGITVPPIISDIEANFTDKSFTLVVTQDAVNNLQECGGVGYCRKDKSECICTDHSHFGPNCEHTCDTRKNCFHGQCTPFCNCNRNWYGSTCNTYCISERTCTGHGHCNTFGNCLCDETYYGSDCNTHCEASTTCNGNGVCTVNGTCACEVKGFFELDRIQLDSGCTLATNYSFVGFLVGAAGGGCFFMVMVIGQLIKNHQKAKRLRYEYQDVSR